MSCTRETEYVTSECDPATGALIPPLFLSTTFERDEEGRLRGPEQAPFMYSRLGNPTRLHFEEAFTRLEKGGGESFAFSSGMQAATSLLMSCPRAHVILPDDLYHGVHLIISSVLKNWGMTMETVDYTNHASLQSCLEKLVGFNEGKHTAEKKQVVLWLETPSNPQCKVTDIKTICSMAHSLFHGTENVTIIVDSTWATPYLLNPLLLGADFVLHSVTKYIGGHSDVLGGIVTASKSLLHEIQEKDSEHSFPKNVLVNLRLMHRVGGGVCGPLESWMAARGLRTLPVRVTQQCSSALQIAKALESLPGIEKVFYPGLLSHPQHDLATEQMGGRYGGMLSFLVKSKDGSDGGKEALQVTRGVKLFKAATSLGGTESLIEHRRSVEGDHPVSPPSLLRLSVGLESPEDLIVDLENAIRLSFGH